MRMIENMGLATEDEKLQNLLVLADADEPEVIDEQDLDSDVEDTELGAELPFGPFELGFDLEDGLGELGAARRRRRRRRGTRKGQRRKTARRAYKGKRRRRRRRKSAVSGLGAGKKRRRRRRRGTRKGQRRKTARRAYKGLKRRKRRRGRKLSKKALSRKMRRIAKKRGRTAKGRFKKGAIEGLSDELYADLMGISASEGLGDFGDFVTADEDGLGAIGAMGRTHKRRRKSRKGRRRKSRGRRRGRKARKGRRRKGRKGRRRRGGRRLSGLGRLASMGDAIGQAEVTASTPILGVFEWMATTPGLEALAGVAAAPFVTGLVGMGINAVMPPAEGETETPMLKTVAQSLISAIGVWELGRLVGSGNIGKFGAFYIFGRLIESQVSARVVGDEMAEKMGLGQVLLPQIKRPDYAVNPLSNFGTVRVPDTSEIGTVRVPDTSEIGTVRVPDTSEIGTVRIPDYEMEGGVGQEETVTEEELLGQYEGEGGGGEEDVEGTDLF